MDKTSLVTLKDEIINNLDPDMLRCSICKKWFHKDEGQRKGERLKQFDRIQSGDIGYNHNQPESVVMFTRHSPVIHRDVVIRGSHICGKCNG